MPFRLAPDQMRRLERASRRRGQTKQAFVEGAVLSEIAQEEERRAQLREAPTAKKQNTNDVVPGSSLAELLRQRAVPPVPPEPIPGNAQGQVVVNVGGGGNGGGSSSGDLIETLAAFVTSGHDFEQQQNLRVAVSIIQRTTQDEEKRKVLAAKLDEAIALKTKTKAADGGGILHTAKVTFDKLSDLLRR